jgi:hypothetical protein
MVAFSLIAVTVKRLIAFCVLSLAVWHITASLMSGVPNGKVLVYVSGRPTLMTVDHRPYAINAQVSEPVICTLAPGSHILRLERNGKAIFEESFTVEAQREQTIFAPGRTAMSPIADNVEPSRNEPVANSATVPVRQTAFRDRAAGDEHPGAVGN